MGELLSLAERCEQATGPDFALDAAIATAAAGYILERRGRDQKAWFYHPVERRRSASEYSGFDRLPRYTASLDAAMTLVPEGCHVAQERTVCGDGSICCQADVWGREGRPDNWMAENWATPALALCAAALKARAACR